MNIVKFLKTLLLFLVVFFVVLGILVFSSSVINKNKDNPENDSITTQTPSAEPTGTDEDESKSDNAKIDSILNSMTTEEKIYQMLFVTPESLTGVGQVIAAGETTKNALAERPVGGIIFFAQNLQNREQTQTMLKNCQSFSKIPLFLGVDEEGGRVARVASNIAMGVEKTPPMRQIGNTGDPDNAYDACAQIAKNLKELGFNVDFAPVADVIVNENNTEIGDRSFGTDADKVADMVAKAVGGFEDNKIASVLKHFPGHGSTSVDSHTGYSQSTRTIDELRKNEFKPFKAGIDAGADFVMVSHMTLVNATTQNLPATMSSEVITDMLLGELAFKGIVITDSFSMGAITENYSQETAIVKSIEAGADIILMPKNVEVAYNAIDKAVKDGKISEERIDRSVRKILEIKMEKGLFS